MLTGERINGEEAHRLGMLDYLVHDASALMQRTHAVLESILASGPIASISTKRLLRRIADSRDLDGHALAGYLDYASDVFARQMRTEAIEGVAASRDKRKPNWACSVEI